jgi:hypothetical protein
LIGGTAPKSAVAPLTFVLADIVDIVAINRRHEAPSQYPRWSLAPALKSSAGARLAGG